MKFRDIPLGGCFKLGRSGKIHRKISDETYLDDSVGPEGTLPPNKRVRTDSCPVQKALIELGNSRRRK